EKTVRNHTSKIYAKLELQNRQHAIRTYGHLF
ncbi:MULTISPECIES: LuxR C-terminal-related transcriptional regulator, partial [unclassified Ruegeria]